GGARFEPPWTLALVQELHALLARNIPSDPLPGSLRTRPFTIYGSGGAAVYRACPPTRVSAELSALLSWVDRAGPTLNPLIPAAVLLQGFHSIRPFPSGNLTVGWTMAQMQ
ncbi:MAG: Fic family protein, partial [Thermoplasmata archaeon]|nr:Fic family protein [Thermoplasmata archaeon]